MKQGKSIVKVLSRRARTICGFLAFPCKVHVKDSAPGDRDHAIKKVKPNPGSVLGTVGLVAGIAFLGPVMSGSTDMDNIVPLFLLGTGLIAAGIAGLVPPQPYQIKKAVMRFYEVPMEEMARGSDYQR